MDWPALRHTVVGVRRSDLALAGIACAAVPGMRPVSVQEVSRGASDEKPSHQSAIVKDSTGRTWVVRVPLTAVAGAELERNESLVTQLGKHLPFKVPAASGFAPLGAERGRAAVYPYVEGSALNLHHLPPGPGLASAVGRAIAAVHNISVDIFEDYAVPTFDAASHRQRCVAELDRVAATGLVPMGLLARWEQAFDADQLWDFASTPTHGALNGWAFLAAFTDDDAATGRVVAMTHWDQASVTDPAQDFAILTDELTPAALASVVESYSLARSQRPDQHLMVRARLAAEMRLIRGLAQAVAQDADDVVQFRVDELRKLDRLTAVDDPLVPVGPVARATSSDTVSATESPTAHGDATPMGTGTEMGTDAGTDTDVDKATDTLPIDIQDPTVTLPRVVLDDGLNDGLDDDLGPDVSVDPVPDAEPVVNPDADDGDSDRESR